MKPRVLIIIGLLAAVGGVLHLSRAGKPENLESGETGSLAPAPVPVQERTEISFLYSTEKKAWVEEAAAAFQKTHPAIRLYLVERGSLDAAQAILDGRERPTVWSPADTAVLRMLESDWATAPERGPLFARQGEEAPQSLVITPLVFVVWEDRANVLLASSGGKQISWRTIQKAVSSDQGWPSIGGKEEWGFVKLGQTDPTRSNSGLQAMLLATFEYHHKRMGLTVGDVLDAKYQEWIKQMERGVARFETSTRMVMTDMVRFGPSRYDIAVVYENLAIWQISNATERWGKLKVYYPPLTLWSDHPAVVLQAEWVTPRQKAAAREWLAYLRSHPVQRRALAFGFRPADPEVPIQTPDAANPFSRFADHGIQAEVPPAAEVPEGPVVRNLLTMWTRVVGTR